MASLQFTQRQTDMLTEFEATLIPILTKFDMSDAEIKAFLCGLVARVAFRAKADLAEMHALSDAAYDYYIKQQEEPSDA